MAFIIIIVCGVVGILFAAYQYKVINDIEIPMTDAAAEPFLSSANSGAEHAALVDNKEDDEPTEVTLFNFTELNRIYEIVRVGAQAFLVSQYTLCVKFTIGFAIVIAVLTSSSSKVTSDGKSTEHAWEWGIGLLTATSFVTGALTSILAGYIGMTVAVYANARVTVEAVRPGALGWRGSFNAAFIAGSVMGFALCGLALLVLFVLIVVFNSFGDDYSMSNGKLTSAKRLFECIAGYGLGGSCMALFGRVGGGIFTKAADVGADLSGKVCGYTDPVTKVHQLLKEDDPKNPATIADNVGDNVGDVAGMGSDLFGSFAEASCAALVISASSPEIVSVGPAAMMFPLLVSAAGIVMCLITSFGATHIQTVAEHKDVETVLKVQLFTSALLMSIATLPLALLFLPNEFTFEGLYKITPMGSDATQEMQKCSHIGAWVCVVCGLWGGCLIGFITEYYTSASYKPVQEVARSCRTGAATNIIYGLALGYLSTILPITLLAINVFVAFLLCGMYGVALAALGMLGTLSTCLSIDVYGPIADNAGGLAEMAIFPAFVRDKTDALDAAGNTTAAIGKGFAIGSAALVSLALFGGFVARLTAHSKQVNGTPLPVIINVLQPITFAFLFIGAMLPYWFTAYCMKSVGEAAEQMVANVKEQFKANGVGIFDGTIVPDYAACIKISTDASLKEMVAPACLVIFFPLLTGILFGVEAVSGLLVGSLISAVQLAISQSNSGGAWDNAKKYVEAGKVTEEMEITQNFVESGHPDAESYACEVGKTMQVKMGKKTEVHVAAIIGDTVGDPLKDTSGPALNIVMKLMAILSLVFSDFFVSVFHGRGLCQIPTTLNLVCTSSGECPTA